MSPSENRIKVPGSVWLFVGLSFILDLKQRGIALKVAKLWQVIALPTSILEEYMTCRLALGLDLHPAGIEPATL